NKVVNLRRAHETIRKKITHYFYGKPHLPLPEYYIQGSYKMKTVVENRTTKSDVDLAIIFPSFPGVKLETLQNHVRNALWNHTTKGVIVKDPCVRLTYVRDFHIDLPIYFRNQVDGQLYFGSRGNDWTPSDPKAFVKWFKENTNNRPQLVRIIRYLKAWADYTKTKTRKKLPSGLALTLWAIDYYKPSSRDDIALFQTCSSILNYLKEYFQFQWSAKMPVAPYDNVLNKLSRSNKAAFYDEWKEMVSLMAEAVSSERKSIAVSKWKRVFGKRINEAIILS
ncbi:nucleotidyltransferase, partial [Reichenbachiella sp.]